jgi:Ran GTPase-activating protein (RanGAP) involved in mRNA processing and transport
MTGEGLAILLALSSLDHLRELDLSFNLIGDEGARMLVDSPSLSSLRVLDLRDNDEMSEEARTVVRARFGDRVLC